MSKAYVNGVECVVYGFYEGDGIDVEVFYPSMGESGRHRVPASMVEVRYEV